MADACEAILLQRRDYYKVLAVSRDATVEEIKRAYKLKAMVCHPDKCTHPRASEAFQLVGAAHETLKDPKKRAVYDRHGADGVQRHESGGGDGGQNPYQQRRQGHPQFQHPFEEFFFNFQRPQQRRPGANGHEAQFQEVNLNMFMLVPVLLFILLAMMLQTNVSDSSSSGFSSQSGYGHQRSKQNFITAFSLAPKYDEQMTIQRTTSHPHYRDLTVSYYVSRQWNDYANRGYIDIRKVEIEVLRKYRDSLGRKCESEALRQRSKGGGGGGVPDVCKEYDGIRERVRG
ncbi:DNA-J protein, putative [Bodo saltans]|uniref:DNA-J protein, putative n=1 Tax=Bodo saltans TaxID=75058 RepID=A0A0S4JTE9_BODSA|nr:DNA-J protein, putative [Bodo saltans]|eukprot:CUG93498.1 DNA-J protein, putative [Bodo saltans]